MGKVESSKQNFSSCKKINIRDTLFGSKPVMVDLPLESIYEETIVGSSAQSERERNARNAQQKLNWQHKCQTN